MHKVFALFISAALFTGVGFVMSPSAHLACLMPVAAAQGIPSPPPGNPNHEEPAPGSNCVHNPANPDHNCTCHKRCEQSPDGNSAVVIEDNVACRSACYKNHCACPAENCE